MQAFCYWKWKTLMLLSFAVSSRIFAFSPRTKPICLFSRHSTSSKRRFLASSSSSSSTIPQYWNREESAPTTYADTTPIIKEARILSLSKVDDPANAILHQGTLPDKSQLLGIGASLQDFGDLQELREKEPNVVFVSHPLSRKPLADMIQALPSLEWIHTRSAGIDFVTSPTLSSFGGTVTNAKGCFSSTLAEYTMMACSYFAKDLPRLLRQKRDGTWEKYPVLELRGATLGVVGYGDIGRSAAKLAKAYGMNIVALRRNPGVQDDICDRVYGNDPESLRRLFSECDYVLCAAPLTPETKGMIGKECFDSAKDGCVFINVGQGPIVDEQAMVEALKDGRLKGAGLDVVAVEPLPKESELWGLENVLLSPHNMDMTTTFMHEATEFFVRENLERFVRGQELLNPVNPAHGY